MNTIMFYMMGSPKYAHIQSDFGEIPANYKAVTYTIKNLFNHIPTGAMMLKEEYIDHQMTRLNTGISYNTKGWGPSTVHVDSGTGLSFDLSSEQRRRFMPFFTVKGKDLVINAVTLFNRFKDNATTLTGFSLKFPMRQLHTFDKSVRCSFTFEGVKHIITTSANLKCQSVHHNGVTFITLVLSISNPLTSSTIDVSLKNFGISNIEIEII